MLRTVAFNAVYAQHPADRTAVFSAASKGGGKAADKAAAEPAIVLEGDQQAAAGDGQQKQAGRRYECRHQPRLLTRQSGVFWRERRNMPRRDIVGSRSGSAEHMWREVQGPNGCCCCEGRQVLQCADDGTSVSSTLSDANRWHA